MVGVIVGWASGAVRSAAAADVVDLAWALRWLRCRGRLRPWTRGLSGDVGAAGGREAVVKVRTWTYGRKPAPSRKVYFWLRRYTVSLSIHEANRRG